MIPLTKALFRALVLAIGVTLLLIFVGNVMREGPAQLNRIRSVTIDIERELGKLAGR